MILNPAFSESCNTASSPPIKLSIWCDYINTKLIHINITAAIEPRLARVITTSVVALSRFLPCFRPFSLFPFFYFCKGKAGEKDLCSPDDSAYTLWLWLWLHLPLLSFFLFLPKFVGVAGENSFLREIHSRFRFPSLDLGPFPVCSEAF